MPVFLNLWQLFVCSLGIACAAIVCVWQDSCTSTQLCRLTFFSLYGLVFDPSVFGRFQTSCLVCSHKNLYFLNCTSLVCCLFASWRYSWYCTAELVIYMLSLPHVLTMLCLCVLL
jgi:hypothetical protein